jgi:hypothetical protein
VSSCQKKQLHGKKRESAQKQKQAVSLPWIREKWGVYCVVMCVLFVKSEECAKTQGKNCIAFSACAASVMFLEMFPPPKANSVENEMSRGRPASPTILSK